MYLLTRLPECYSVLATALETSTEVPKLAVVTKQLLHEETKMKSRLSNYYQEVTSFRKKPTCHFCNKLGHVRRDCEDCAGSKVKLEYSRVRTGRLELLG